MPQSSAEKQRTNVTLNADTLAAARELGLNVSAISDAALAAAVRTTRAEAWAKEFAGAISQRLPWIEAQGKPLGDRQVLKIN